MSKREQSVQTTQAALEAARNARKDVTPTTSAPVRAPVGMMSELLQKEQTGLRQQLEELQGKFPPGSLAVHKLDPNKIRWSRFYNRSPESFLASNPSFKELLVKVEASQGNTVPVLAFKLPSPDNGYEYELSYGHRRLEATKQLGLEVMAIVLDTMSQEEQAKMQVLENEGRSDVSVLEKAKQFSSHMKAGVWGTVEAFASAVGMTRTHAQALKSMGDHIPDSLILAHPNVTSINFRQAQALVKLAKEDPKLMRDRIETLRGKRDQISAPQATTLLLYGSIKKPLTTTEGKGSAKVTKRGDSVVISFASGGSGKETQLIEHFKKLCEELDIEIKGS